MQSKGIFKDMFGSQNGWRMRTLRPQRVQDQIRRVQNVQCAKLLSQGQGSTRRESSDSPEPCCAELPILPLFLLPLYKSHFPRTLDLSCVFGKQKGVRARCCLFHGVKEGSTILGEEDSHLKEISRLWEEEGKLGKLHLGEFLSLSFTF